MVALTGGKGEGFQDISYSWKEGNLVCKSNKSPCLHVSYSNTPLKIRMCDEHILVDAKLTVMSRCVFKFLKSIFKRHFRMTAI